MACLAIRAAHEIAVSRSLHQPQRLPS